LVAFFSDLGVLAVQFFSGVSVPDAIDTALIHYIRQSKSALVDLCARLIQTPSVNGIHPERSLAEIVAAQAEHMGLHTHIVGDLPDRPNLIVSTAPDGATGLLLLGHLDTVPPGDETLWTYPPYSGHIAQGRIYGRGAIDTKGGMSAALIALAALKAVPDALHRGRAQLICVPDEETGATGTLGIKYLHSRGLLTGLGAIYAYSGDQITLGHRGLVRYRLTCHGQSVHTGSEEWQNQTAGVNAVTGMARLLVALETLHLETSHAPFFERFRTVITPGTLITGGTSINIVPDRCEALVDIRLTPEYHRADLDRLIDNLQAHVEQQRPGLRFERDLLVDAPAALCDPGAAVVAALEESLQTVKGKSSERVVAGPANEGYLLIERGIPTICGFGPTGENAHAVDEYVDIAGLVDAAAIFSLTARRLSAYLD
jgi:acetylornithine deacetylase/succinyl-diaminopimelate desuccinylase-like protein